MLPTRQEIAEFRQDQSPDRRRKVIDRLLADPRWADHWVSYWQDVLGENPGILKPELNNTGPFRWWIHESLADNKPLDRFATELVMMEGSKYSGGPAGFGLAAQNDAPMAEKAHTLVKAFLGVDLKCARCHDAPYHPFRQKDTFSLAAMLKRETMSLPKTSTVPVVAGGRVPLVKISLKPGDQITAAWTLPDIAPGDLPPGLLRSDDDSRERLAAILTSPENERFATVLANRVWLRLLGWGLTPNAEDFHTAQPTQPEVLGVLAWELATHDYDLKHLVRLVMNSAAYQRPATTTASNDSPLPLPIRRRMTAEQVVDSTYAAVEKPLHSEGLTFDPEARRPVKEMQNLGVPTRAWEFASMSNERDRPALSLPVAQSIVDLLGTFGWRESRPNPLTVRDHAPNVLQPLLLANGVAGNRATILSDESAITRLSLEDRPLDGLISDVFLQILSRPPDPSEQATFRDLLRAGYEDRRAPETAARTPAAAGPRNNVSWSNHLSPEATRIKLEMEKLARAGDPPTARLHSEWRERMEDMVWALLNSPEFVFVP